MRSKVKRQQVTALLFVSSLVGIPLIPALAQTPVAQVTGTIDSSQGLPLAGASVHFLSRSAGRRLTVFADNQGHYRIDLPAGSFLVSSETRGYRGALESGPLVTNPGETHEVHLTLKQLENPLDLERQINGAELLSALPTHERQEFVHRCTGCHSLGVAGGVRLPERGWQATVTRMSGQHPNSKGNLGAWGPWERSSWSDTIPKLAKFLGSESPALDYQTFPITNSVDHLSQVLIQEFDLVRPEIYTHDVAADLQRDRVWYGDQAADKVDAIGRFGWYDPSTGQSQEFEVPPCTGFTRAFTEQRTGRVWVGCDHALAYWDPKTDQAVILPLELGDRTMHGLAFDSEGNIWLPLLNKTANMNENEYDYIARFNPETSALTEYRIPTPLSGPYEVQVDSKDQIWFTEIVADQIGKLDPSTGKFTEYPIPTPNGAPRRFDIDSKDNVWFVEFVGNKLGVVDSSTGKIREYDIPTPLSFPYACSVDRNDIVWFSEIFGNRIGRFDPKTETFREYPIPAPLSGIKKLDFTYAEGKEIVWGGYRVGAKVVRFEIPMQ